MEKKKISKPNWKALLTVMYTAHAALVLINSLSSTAKSKAALKTYEGAIEAVKKLDKRKKESYLNAVMIITVAVQEIQIMSMQPQPLSKFKKGGIAIVGEPHGVEIVQPIGLQPIEPQTIRQKVTVQKQRK